MSVKNQFDQILIGKWTSCILLYTINTFSSKYINDCPVYARICLLFTLLNEIHLVHVCGYRYPVKRIFIYVLLCAFCKMHGWLGSWLWTRDRPSKIVFGRYEQMTGYGEEQVPITQERMGATIDFAKTTYRYTHFHPHTPEVCVCGSSYTMWACAQVWKSSIQPLKPLSYNCKWNGSQMIGTIYFLYQARVKPHQPYFLFFI